MKNPDLNLANLRRACGQPAGSFTATDSDIIAGLFNDLDALLSGGGPLPQAWRPPTHLPRHLPAATAATATASWNQLHALAYRKTFTADEWIATRDRLVDLTARLPAAERARLAGPFALIVTQRFVSRRPA